MCPRFYKWCSWQVMAAVFGPREMEIRSQAQQDRAVVKCEYAMAPFSTGTRPLLQPHARSHSNTGHPQPSFIKAWMVGHAG